MDPSRLRKRVLRNLLTAPRILLPGLFGAGSLLLGLLAGSPLGFWGIAGLGGLAVSAAGMAGTWLLRFDRLAQEAADDVRTEEERRHFTYLRQLQRQLRIYRDPRTGFIIQEMRRLYHRLERASLLGPRRRNDVLPEILDQAEALYRSCLASIERALELSVAAQELATAEARQQVLQSRENLLSEVETSIRHLDATLDHLQTAVLRSGQQEADLARTREELDMGLKVARRVEQRVGELEQSLKGAEADVRPPAT